MDWRNLVSGAFIVIGLWFAVTAPPDPMIETYVQKVDSPTNESVVAFENLSEENRAVFLDELNGEDPHFADAPFTGVKYVAYEGETYEYYFGGQPSGRIINMYLSGLFIVIGGLIWIALTAYRSR